MKAGTIFLWFTSVSPSAQNSNWCTLLSLSNYLWMNGICLVGDVKEEVGNYFDSSSLGWWLTAVWGMCSHRSILEMDRWIQGLFLNQIPETSGPMYHKFSAASGNINHCDSEISSFFSHGIVILWIFSGLCDVRANYLTFLELSLLIYKMRPLN